MITLQTWKKELARVGDYWARRNLRHITQGNRRPYRREQPEIFTLLCALAHLPGGTPSENRKKYADIFRIALTRQRENRLRVQSYSVNRQQGNEPPASLQSGGCSDTGDSRGGIHTP